MGKQLNTTNDGQTGGSAYLAAIKALRAYINKDYENGGWLPSGRGMAQSMKTSHPTYCKAVKFLESEGILKSYPKKGHYVVPHYLRCEKIGFILYNGGESPFLRQDTDVSGAIDLITASAYDAQILQAVTLKQLHDNALIYGMKGVLWFCPPPKASATIKAFNTAGTVPLVVIQNEVSDADFGPHVVAYDTKDNIQNRVTCLLDRGHRAIAYVGNYEQARKAGIVELIEAAGGQLTPEYCVPDIDKTPGKIARLVEAKKVTGILSEGGGFTIKCLFEELSELPKAAQPEVVAPDFARLAKLAQRFPKIKLAPLKNQLSNTLGREAASMLLVHLTEGKALSTRKIKVI